MKFFTSFIVAFFFVFSSCKTKKEVESIRSTDKIVAHNGTFKEILSGSHSNMPKRELAVLNTKAELDRVYGVINSTRKPGYVIPVIDFSKDAVVCLFMGVKGSGGYSIFIDRIVYTDKETIIYYLEKNPSGMATSVLTQPFYLATIKKTDKPVRFVSRK